jgi:hypothetical protein
MITIKRTNIIPWRHQADWETPPRLARTPRSRPPPRLPALHLWGFIYRKGELTKIIAQQVVENNVHELTKGGELM